MGEGGGADKKDKAGEERGPEEEEIEKPRCCGCRFPLLVALLQLLLGAAIAVLAFFMVTISPSLLARETPHWAGIILCLVSLLGFLLYAVTYLPDERTSMQFIAKVVYFLLCTVGVVVSVVALAFSGHHYQQVSSFSACESMADSCRCTLDRDDPIARVFTYDGVADCDVITSTLVLLFLLQMLLNLVQAVVCAAGAFIMWKHRYQVFFTGLQIGPPSSQGWHKV